MPILVVLALFALAVKFNTGPFRAKETKVYFIPSVAWYKAKVTVNPRSEYRIRSRY